MDYSQVKPAQTVNQPVYKRFQASLYSHELWHVTGLTRKVNGPNHNRF